MFFILDSLKIETNTRKYLNVYQISSSPSDESIIYLDLQWSSLRLQVFLDYEPVNFYIIELEENVPYISSDLVVFNMAVVMRNSDNFAIVRYNFTQDKRSGQLNYRIEQELTILDIGILDKDSSLTTQFLQDEADNLLLYIMDDILINEYRLED